MSKNKIQPGEGWRLLEKDEEFAWGDEGTNTGKAWYRYGCDGARDFAYCRRRIPDPIPRPKPAKTDLVPGWYTNADEDKVYFVGVDGDGNYVFTHYGEVFIGCGKVFVPYLTPYTPPPKPRTWTVDVVVYEVPDGEYVGHCIKEVGEKLFIETNKELGRTTATIKEKVTQCPPQ